MTLSAKVAGIAPSATLAIANRAKALQRAGVDVISLSVGEPDFATPAHITEACIAALRRGETHYAPGNGLPPLLDAIAAKSRDENRIPCDPSQVIVTAGAKDAIHQAMQAVLNPGDEVIVLTPDWVSYEPCVRLAEGVPVFVAVDPATFQADRRAPRGRDAADADDRRELALEPLGGGAEPGVAPPDRRRLPGQRPRGARGRDLREARLRGRARLARAPCRRWPSGRSR